MIAILIEKLTGRADAVRRLPEPPDADTVAELAELTFRLHHPVRAAVNAPLVTLKRKIDRRRA